MKKNRRFIVPVIVFLAVFLALALFNRGTSEPEVPDLELINSPSMEIDGGLVTLRGKARNNTEYTYEDVSLSFVLLDSNDEEIGKATAELDHLYGTNVWAYEAFAFFPLDMDIASFKLESIDGTKTTEIVYSTEFVPAENTGENTGE